MPRSWHEIETLVASRGGRITRLADDAGVALYDRSKRARELSPTLAQVLARRPSAYCDFLAAHGHVLVGLPGRGSFAFLPPLAAAQLTSALGEPDRGWREVESERRAGTSRFDYVMFAAHEMANVNGWAFGPHPEGGELVVWHVEDSLPIAVAGDFEAWLAERAAKLAATKNGDGGGNEDDDGADDDDDVPTSLDHL